MSWSSLVAERLAGDPDAAAVVSGDGTWTNSDLFRLAAGGARWLDGIDAPVGRPVAALVSASPYGFALLLAGAASRRPLAPLNPRLTVHELTACLERLEPGLIVAEAPLVERARDLGWPVHVLERLEPSDRPLDLALSDERPVCVVHTSGTTGLPKAITQCDRPLGARAEVYRRYLEMGPGDLYVSASPFHHQGGLGMYVVALALGAAVMAFPQFSVEAWRSMAGFEPTHVQIVPTMLRDVVDAGALAIPTLRRIVYGAARMPVELLQRAMAVLPDVGFVQGFSQSEGGPVAMLSVEDHRAAAAGHPELLASVGRIVDGAEVRVHAPDADGVGEIWARYAHSFVVDAEGWQHYGDLGRVENRYLYIAGRLGDAINRGGEKVYPQEVEEVIAAHPGVKEVAVVGVPDERLGAVPHAFVVGVADQEALRAFARERLSGYKVPVHWSFVSELPRNAAGKVMRHRLIERL